MTMTLPRAPRLAAAALALLAPAPSLAQGVGVSAVALSGQHYLLGDPLTGAAVGITLPRRGSRLTFRLGAERMRGGAERTGIPCAGLIQPGTCPPERVRDDARLTGASGGAAFRLLGRRRATIALTADLSLASLRSATRGLTSGDSIWVTKVMWGGAGARP
jgi:hypothetical protein